jgi:predicted AAA+ superfamily ATPase
MFHRHLLQSLDQWKIKKNRLPLIVRGARQTGKTTLVREFAKQFDTFIYLNLENIDDRKLISPSFNDTITALEFRASKKIVPASTVLFLDEIQASPDAVSLLRFFSEQMPDLAVLCAGSLLEVRLSQKTISFPTGRVEYLFLAPMSFSEFLLAKGKSLHVEALASASLTMPLQAHRMIMEEYVQYIQTGGMPAAIREFLETASLAGVRRLHANLLQSVLDDVGKYLPRAESKYIETALDGTPGHCGERIRFENFNNSQFKSREMKNAFSMLQKAFLVYCVYPTSSPVLPMVQNFRKAPKLFFYDIGMMNSRLGVPITLDVALTDCGMRGMVAEQFVFQELLASSRQLPMIPMFWTRESGNSNAEIDFCDQWNEYMVPMEVKSGASGTLKSIGIFMASASQRIAIRFYNAPPSVQKPVTTGVGKDFTLLNLPLYYAGNWKPAYEKVVSGKTD